MANASTPQQTTKPPELAPKPTEEEPVIATLVVRDETSFRRQMEPTKFEQLYQIAIELSKVKLCGVENAQEAMARMLTGRELGLTMMQAMRGVHVIKGQPALSAALKRSICVSHPDVCEKFELVESTDEKCVYRVKRKGQPERDFTWTMADAKRALLVKAESNWEKYPRRMLQARASAEAADTLFADLLLGFATQEEMVDLHEPSPRETVEQTTTVVQKAAAPRDYAAEAEALKLEIKNAKTKEERKAVRARLEAWDGISPFREQLIQAYNDSKPPAAAKPAAAPAKPPVQDQHPGGESGVPEGRMPGED